MTFMQIAVLVAINAALLAGVISLLRARKRAEDEDVKTFLRWAIRGAVIVWAFTLVWQADYLFGPRGDQWNAARDNQYQPPDPGPPTPTEPPPLKEEDTEQAVEVHKQELDDFSASFEEPDVE